MDSEGEDVCEDWTSYVVFGQDELHGVYDSSKPFVVRNSIEAVAWLCQSRLQ